MLAFISTGVFTPSKMVDIPALISVLACAFTLPLLSLQILAAFDDVSRKFTIADTLGLKIAYWIGSVYALLGIVAAFWHISWVAGLVVLISGLVGRLVYVDYRQRLRRLDRALKAEGIENLGREESE
jgi:hypothetical protein